MGNIRHGLFLFLISALVLLPARTGAQTRTGAIQMASGRATVLFMPDYGRYSQTDIQLGVDYTCIFEAADRLYVGGNIGLRRSLSSPMYTSMMFAFREPLGIDRMDGEGDFSYKGSYVTQISSSSSYDLSYLPSVMIPLGAVARYFFTDPEGKVGMYAGGKLGITISDFHDLSIAPTFGAEVGHMIPLSNGNALVVGLDISGLCGHHRYTLYDFDPTDKMEETSCPLSDVPHHHYALKAYKGICLGVSMSVSYQF